MANDSNTETTQEEALGAGVRILLWLAILTIGEFLVASIAPVWLWALWMAAIWKAIYVVNDYMHIKKVFKDEEAH